MNRRRRRQIKINILGTEYDFDITTEKTDSRLCGADGYCDAYEKRIAVENEHNEKRPGCIGDYAALKAKVKRHEIIHAYLFESGLSEYANNEQFVEWMAWHIPNMLKSFKQVGAID